MNPEDELLAVAKSGPTAATIPALLWRGLFNVGFFFATLIGFFFP